MIKLALADDQLLFRKGLAMLLSDMAGATVVWECANGEELLDAPDQDRTSDGEGGRVEHA